MKPTKFCRRRRFLTVVCSIFIMVILSQTWVFAQGPPCACPPVPTGDAQSDPTPIPWTGGNITATINGCTFTICYACRQTSSTNFDYMVTQMCVDSACFVNSGMSWQQALRGALNALFAQNPCQFPCPTCPDASTYWQEYQLSCWQTVIVYDPITGNRTYQRTACQGTGWCIVPYTVCCTNGVPTFTQGNPTSVNWQCQQPCTIGNCPP